jgi:DNA/RNA-binding domain of Phe-tRNA-synthetase-like protein
VSKGAPADPSPGWIASEVAEEFPQLRLWRLGLAARSTRSPPELRERLRELSDRFRGPQAVAMRRQPVPWAYRVFFRHIGLDPDTDRTPVEALALDRLIKGGFRSRNLLDDALTIAVMETGVPIWALDGDRVEGELGIRAASGREPLGRAPDPPWPPAGRLVVADAEGPLAVLFGALAPGHGVTAETTRMLLFSVQVAGVPSIHVEEGLWLVADVLSEPSSG